MKQLLLLILCLLATFKSFSQKDTISNTIVPYVFLTETQAKAVVKDIIHMEYLELTNVELNKRVNIFLEKESFYSKLLQSKDTIIDNQSKIIAIKDDLLDNKRSFEFHAYTGVSIFNLDFNEPILYGKVQFEFKKLNFGTTIDFKPVIQTDTFSSVINYSIYAEYKIF